MGASSSVADTSKDEVTFTCVTCCTTCRNPAEAKHRKRQGFSDDYEVDKERMKQLQLPKGRQDTLKTKIHVGIVGGITPEIHQDHDVMDTNIFKPKTAGYYTGLERLHQTPTEEEAHNCFRPALKVGHSGSSSPQNAGDKRRSHRSTSPGRLMHGSEAAGHVNYVRHHLRRVPDADHESPARGHEHTSSGRSRESGRSQSPRRFSGRSQSPRRFSHGPMENVEAGRDPGHVLKFNNHNGKSHTVGEVVVSKGLRRHKNFQDGCEKGFESKYIRPGMGDKEVCYFLGCTFLAFGEVSLLFTDF